MIFIIKIKDWLDFTGLDVTGFCRSLYSEIKEFTWIRKHVCPYKIIVY